MGLSSRFSLHARHRHGPYRGDDHGKTPPRKGRRGRGACRLAACLTALSLATGAAADSFRVALFHTEFGRDGPGLFYRDLYRAKDPQIEAGLRILSHIDADILVLGGLDFDADHLALNLLADRLGYAHTFAAAPNRGIATARDLNRDGRLGGPDDALGYGEFRGAEGMAVLSRYPLLTTEMADATATTWADFPGNIAPPETAAVERISTTVHWRLPIRLPDGGELALIAWHATPPVFDGPEDRNGRRNRDEARLAETLIAGATRPVVVAAFANLDPVDGDGRKEAIAGLLDHPDLTDPQPRSVGAVKAALRDGQRNAFHRGDPALDTVDWPDGPNRPGNLRTDYILPARSIDVLASGVLWPDRDQALNDDVETASRHRIVWLDLSFGPDR